MKEKKHTISVVSNITVEPFLVPVLEDLFAENTIEICCNFIPYEEFQTSDLHAETVVVWLNLESMLPDLEDKKYDVHMLQDTLQLCENLYQHLASQNAHGNIIWILFEDYHDKLSVVKGHNYSGFVDELNCQMHKNYKENIIFIDLKYLIAKVGVKAAYDVRNKHRWNLPYSKLLVENMAREMKKQYDIRHGITKKCLVLDCDNVLWGGILSEDGLENIRLGKSGLGQEYREFQAFVYSLYSRGVILAICSKNDLQDVLRMFREHDAMILKEEHIAYFQVDWGDKPNNIMKIANALHIGTDSMVFVDDSSFEVEAVKAMLPEVTAILYQREMDYEQFSCFNLCCEAQPAVYAKRNETYRTDVSRRRLQQQFEDYDQYLNALEMRIEIHSARMWEYSRIAELTQRTNRCTNGVRYTVNDLKEFTKDESAHLYAVYLADRFSDLGLVGAIGIQNNRLVLFSLSCRALGRNLEKRMISHIKEQCEIAAFCFLSTGRNQGVEALLSESFGKRK